MANWPMWKILVFFVLLGILNGVIGGLVILFNGYVFGS